MWIALKEVWTNSRGWSVSVDTYCNGCIFSPGAEANIHQLLMDVQERERGFHYLPCDCLLICLNEREIRRKVENFKIL